MSALGFIFYRLLAVTALASAANVGLAQPRVSCPTRAWTYVEKTNACYKAILDRVTWEDAFESCKRVNATLPVIHDANTEKALLEPSHSAETVISYDLLTPPPDHQHFGASFVDALCGDAVLSAIATRLRDRL